MYGVRISDVCADALHALLIANPCACVHGCLLRVSYQEMGCLQLVGHLVLCDSFNPIKS